MDTLGSGVASMSAEIEVLHRARYEETDGMSISMIVIALAAVVVGMILVYGVLGKK